MVKIGLVFIILMFYNAIMKDTEALLKHLLNRHSPINSGQFFINAIAMGCLVFGLIIAYTSYYFTKKYYEHKVDPEVLQYIKNPSSAIEIEQQIVKLLDQKKQIQSQLNQSDYNLSQNRIKMEEVNRKYEDIKNKLVNEKLIYDDAFKEQVELVRSEYEQKLKAAENEAYDSGVGTGVIGTIGVQMLLGD